jgi:membrane associated rhomboid family serine protease
LPLFRSAYVKSLMRRDAPGANLVRMLPLSDGLPARRFPIVTIAIIAANFAVWLFYELPHLNSSVAYASFYACTVDGSCHGPEPVWISWFTSMFLHGSWGHILGNMLFLGVFGKNVEDSFGRLGYLLFYIAGGFAATAAQAAMTLLAGSAADARVPNLGASGAIAAVLGAYFVLYPNARIFGLIGIFPVRISAWFFLGFWFLYQLFEANFGLFEAQANGGGVAFFAHVGGFVFGYVVARAALARGRPGPQAAFGASG